MKQQVGPGAIVAVVVVLLVILGFVGWKVLVPHPVAGTAAPGQNPPLPKEMNGHPVPPNAPVYFPVQGSGSAATPMAPTRQGGPGR